MITRENYEEYIMMYVDGELQPAQEEALHNFLDQNPELKNDLHAYELTKLTPDNAITFKGNESLLKTSGKRVIAHPGWAKYGIAAGIAAIFFITIFRFITTNKNEVATKDQVVSVPHNNVEKRVQETQAPKPVESVTIAKKDTMITASISYPTRGNLEAKRDVKHKETTSAPTEHNIPDLAAIVINKIEATSLNQLTSKPETLAPSSIQVPAYTVAVNTEQKKTFWDKLPIDDLKKQQLNNISADIKNGLDEKVLSVKIEKRKLILSF